MENIMAQVNYTTLLDEAMNQHGDDVFRLMYAYVHNESIAEELAQEVFVKCYLALPKYKQQSSLKTWLYRIAINHAKDYLKSWYHRQVVTHDTYIVTNCDERTVEQQIIEEQQAEELMHSLLALPIKYREVLYLFYYEEQTIVEIAQLLRSNSNTIKTRLRKGKQLLKRTMEEVPYG